MRKTGKTTSQAIAIAVSRMKVWATGKGVDKDTQAKAAAALAEWEKLRAKNAAKSAAKDVVKATYGRPAEILCLSDAVTVFNVDNVRNAWDCRLREARTKAKTDNYAMDQPYIYLYVREMWTDHIIVASDSEGRMFRVDYTVGADGEVTFQEPVEVRTEYVVVNADEAVGKEISDADLQKMAASMPPCYASATDTVLLSISRKPTALAQVLSYHVAGG